jgi:hypothetical protein
MFLASKGDFRSQTALAATTWHTIAGDYTSICPYILRRCSDFFVQFRQYSIEVHGSKHRVRVNSMQQVPFNVMLSELHQKNLNICKKYRGRCLHSLEQLRAIFQLLELSDFENHLLNAKNMKLKYLIICYAMLHAPR